MEIAITVVEANYSAYPIMHQNTPERVESTSLP